MVEIIYVTNVRHTPSCVPGVLYSMYNNVIPRFSYLNHSYSCYYLNKIFRIYLVLSVCILFLSA
jgi:hypothetical protein